MSAKTTFLAHIDYGMNEWYQNNKKNDVGRIRTYAPEGTRFLVLRDNHSATTPEIACWLMQVIDEIFACLIKYNLINFKHVCIPC